MGAELIAALRAGLGAIITGAEFVTMGIGPGVQVRAVARDVQVIQLNQAFRHGGGYEDRIEHVLERALIERQRLEIGCACGMDVSWKGPLLSGQDQNV
jgi:hypothetical protein